ncbi:MAG: PKD domain-containing protein [Bacteroidetes bacterium]|nr:MAG: PKD domain-containing protein [Bacteroidota bacterium]
MQVIFETSDLPGTGHLVEAAIDQFLVEDVSPYPVFSASVTAGCQPLTVTFTDNSDSTATWNWTFAGGEPATSAEQNPTVTFNNPGEFTVMLEVVTNDGNTYTITRPDLIQVQAAPTAGFDYIVLGGEVSFTNTSAYGQSFEWDFGDGSPVSTATEPVHNYDDPGIYTVSLTVTNDCGTAILEQDVLILQVAPQAGFTTSATSGCAPLTVEFTDTSMGNPNTWEWQFPGGEPATSTEQNPTVVYNEAGTYTVILTVSNDVGESQVIQSQFIEVEAEPVAAFEAVADLGEVTFTNNSQNGLTYEWDFGDGSTSNEENPVHTYTTAGEFEVSLTVTNDCGFAVASQTVTIVLTATNELDPAAYTLDASPNPFGDELRVNYSIEPGFGEASLQLYDALGRVVFTTPLEQANGTISLTRQIPEKGIYLLRLTVDGQSGSALRVARL